MSIYSGLGERKAFWEWALKKVGILFDLNPYETPLVHS